MTSKEQKRAYYDKNRESILIRQREYRENNRDAIRDRERRYGLRKRASDKGRWNQLKSGARMRGISVNISFEDFLTLRCKPCDYCSGPLSVSGGGLDRKDSDIGYTGDNCVPCCPDCNTMKGYHLSYDEMKLLIGRRLQLGLPMPSSS